MFPPDTGAIAQPADPADVFRRDERSHDMAFELPSLPYAYDALKPFMSAETLEYHHDKHHQAYVTNGNKLLEGSGLEGKSLEEVVKGSFGKNQPLFNNAGQHYNHIHFWKWMKPNGGGKKMPGAVQRAIDSDLGGYDKFRADFIAAGTGQFGSGWAWVSVKNGKLEISKTPNGESPLVQGAVPILGVDVWEHSYYIDYRNARPKYLEAFVDSLVNWDYVDELLAAAR
jgi:Fe-Mn family superoxide dismutase